MTWLCVEPALGSVFAGSEHDLQIGRTNLDASRMYISESATYLIVRMTMDQLNADWGHHMLELHPGPMSRVDRKMPTFDQVNGPSSMDWFDSWLKGSQGSDLYSHMPPLVRNGTFIARQPIFTGF
ncbi:MAG: hypothetical protein MK100_04825 [Phycisphaerales bacterium]|nr:hypothetical protein [Phycisphaerales bacterium]